MRHADTWGQALCLNNMGTLAFAGGDVDRALALHKTSLAGRRAMKEKWGVAECLEGLARVAEVMGDPERTVHLLGAADRLRHVHGFPLPPDERVPLQRQVAALRSALEEDAFRVAWAAGQGWSLEEALDAGLAMQLPSAPPAAHSTARVRMHLLGPFRLVVDGQPVPEAVWGRPAALILFQYLLVHRHRYVSAEELAETFWPQAPSVETTAVYTTISRVRRALRSLSLPAQLELPGACRLPAAAGTGGVAGRRRLHAGAAGVARSGPAAVPPLRRGARPRARRGTRAGR